MMEVRKSGFMRIIPSLIILLLFYSFAYGKIIYVDDDAVGLNDGSSWENAYVYLQDALADANNAEKPVEIRVAQGIYSPNEGIIAIPEFDWRTTTFQLINGVALKGGYAGFGETDPNSRDIESYETILSGDLNSDDVEVANPIDLLDEPTRVENSYNVVTSDGTDEIAVLDGLTITGGNADNLGYERPDSKRRNGGGMYNWGSPTLDNCTFSSNSAGHYGGGMYNRPTSRPTLTNCTFSRNFAYWGGFGMHNSGSSPMLTNCTFNKNSARRLVGDGGGMNNTGGAPILINCIFSDNSAHAGGGMYNGGGGRPIITDCIFTGNSAMEGGGMSNKGNSMLTNCIFTENSALRGGGMCSGSSTLNNCTFSINSAAYHGGGMYNSGSNSILTNCTFSGNSGDQVGGLYNSGENLVLTNCTFAQNSGQINALYCGIDYDYVTTSPLSPTPDPGSVEIKNCILWDGGNEIGSSTIIITYSNIQGGWEGEGNIDVDPMFV